MLKALNCQMVLQYSIPMTALVVTEGVTSSQMTPNNLHTSKF